MGSYVILRKGMTTVTGLISGLKADQDGLERICIMEMDQWFWLTDGWQFIEEVEDDAEIQPE